MKNRSLALAPTTPILLLKWTQASTWLSCCWHCWPHRWPLPLTACHSVLPGFLVCPLQKFPVEALLASILDRTTFCVGLCTHCKMVCEHSCLPPRPRWRIYRFCEESVLGVGGAPLGLRAAALLLTCITSGGVSHLHSPYSVGRGPRLFVGSAAVDTYAVPVFSSFGRIPRSGIIWPYHILYFPFILKYENSFLVW